MSNLGRALRHRNFRLFFAGQGTSLIGTWLTRFAMGYETYHLSHSTLVLGLVAFFSQAPTAFIAPIAGVLVDRWDRHRTIIATQYAAMFQSGALAVFALTDSMSVWVLLVLGAIQAVINGFDMPARQSFVRQMVDDRADLPNAIALNSALVNVARLIGPVVAAVLVALVGVGWCFALDSLSYIAVIASLMMMRIAKQPPRPRAGGIVDEMRAGLVYVQNHELVRALLLLLAATAVFGGAYMSLLPALAKGGAADELGWMMGASGAGALVGVLYLAKRESTTGLSRVIEACSISLGLGLVLFELTPWLWLRVGLLFVLGAAMIVQRAATNTIVQTVVDDDKLGRVMSIYAVVFFAGAPLGALLEGALASLIGPIHTIAIGGVVCVACALYFRRRL